MMTAPPRTAEQFEQMRAFFARDIAQASVALSQLVKTRNIRMMGAVKDTTPKDLRQMIMTAQKVANICNTFLGTYFLPIFAKYWALRLRFEKAGNDRKVRDLTMKLGNFIGTYSLYEQAHEAGMSVFDIKFDQFHTIATMLGIDKDKDEEEEAETGITWVAADPERIKSKLVSEQIAQHERPIPEMNMKSRFPTFGEAVMLARDMVMSLIEQVPSVPEQKDTEAAKPKSKSQGTKQPTTAKPSPPGAPVRKEEVLVPDDNPSPDSK
jgi:hypothetical protein